MRAIAIRPAAPGGPDVLVPAEIELPALAPTHARVRVHYAGVNFIDVYQRSGAYALPRPLLLGQEGSGEVLALGTEVDPGLGLAPGARVAWVGVQGSYASHVDVPAHRLVVLPAELGLEEAAAAMLQGMTAHYL